MLRGDIYLIDCKGEGHEQKGIRPCVIIQNNIGNHYSPTTIVAYITAKMKAPLPTHVLIGEEIMNRDSTIMLEQMQTVDKKRLIYQIGTLPIDKIIMSLTKEEIKNV